MTRIKRSKAMKYDDDCRYSQEAQDHDLKIIWECDQCKHRREDYPGYNEGGTCHCGGEYVEAGESYC